MPYDPTIGPIRMGDVTVMLYRSSGADNAIVVQVDTKREPWSIPLRVNVNDGHAWGVEWRGPEKRHA